MKKAITKFLSIMLLFIIITGTLPENIYAVIEAPKQFNELDAQVAEMEDKIGKVEGSDSRFEPSAELISYANKKIDVANPTKILDYSDKTANFLPSADEAKEYFIKAVTEGQAGMVLYGDKDFAKNT
ncbi:hypothetical protein, partial [Bacteroides heparinolyticus]|uniref:hypothetical protein n=1 Tax=Prevotella heparinolytica TaxID=28113 RepID=UPI0035A0A8AD